MKKILSILLFLFIISLAQAANESNIAEDLGVSRPSLLPTNPFYFLKEFRRTTQKALTFNNLKKIDLKFTIASEKLAELQKLEQILKEDNIALGKAIENYQSALNELSIEIGNFPDSRQNESAIRFADILIPNGFKHLDFIISLENRENIGEKNLKNLQNAENTLMEIIANFSLKTKSENELSSQIENLSKEYKEWNDQLKLILIINKLKNSFPAEYRYQLMVLEEKLIIKFQSAIVRQNLVNTIPDILNSLAINPVRKIKLLDRIREESINNEIKNAFNLERQNILEKADEQGLIGKIQTEIIIEDLRKIVEEISTLKPKFSMGMIIDTLISKASFNLEQAENSFKFDNYIYAFDQASTAYAAAEVAVKQLVRFNSINYSFDNEIKELKREFDNLVKQAKSKNLDSLKAPDLFKLIDRSEKLLAKLSDMVNKKSKINFDSLGSSLREIQVLFFWIEDELNKF